MMADVTGLLKEVLAWVLGILQLLILGIGTWLIHGKAKAEADISTMKTDIALIKQDSHNKKDDIDKLDKKLDKIESLLLKIQLKLGVKNDE